MCQGELNLRATSDLVLSEAAEPDVLLFTDSQETVEGKISGSFILYEDRK